MMHHDKQHTTNSSSIGINVEQPHEVIVIGQHRIVSRKTTGGGAAAPLILAAMVRMRSVAEAPTLAAKVGSS